MDDVKREIRRLETHIQTHWETMDLEQRKRLMGDLNRLIERHNRSTKESKDREASRAIDESIDRAVSKL